MSCSRPTLRRFWSRCWPGIIFAGRPHSACLITGHFRCKLLLWKACCYSNTTAWVDMSTSAQPEGLLVNKNEITDFTIRCLRAVGTNAEHAEAVADVLVGADYMGHYSHGVNRLEIYVNDIKAGVTIVDQEPKIIKESASTAWVDGMNVLGPIVGNFCMQLAIKKAKKDGVGWVVAKGSNHFGIAGWYSLQASEQGLLGMAFTNTSPLASTTRGRVPMLGTNPLTLAAPATDPTDPFLLDMATTTAALGKIEMCDRKGVSMPRGWGADSEGRETQIPAEALKGGSLLPLGGSEETGGYKGYGLSMMVEIFCGILGGAAYGPNVRKWKMCDQFADLGQCFVAVNPEFFAPGFKDRMADLMHLMRSQTPAAGETEVLVAGDQERRKMEHCDNEAGIRYHPNVVAYLARIVVIRIMVHFLLLMKTFLAGGFYKVNGKIPI